MLEGKGSRQMQHSDEKKCLVGRGAEVRHETRSLSAVIAEAAPQKRGHLTAFTTLITAGTKTRITATPKYTEAAAPTTTATPNTTGAASEDAEVPTTPKSDRLAYIIVALACVTFLASSLMTIPSATDLGTQNPGRLSVATKHHECPCSSSATSATRPMMHPAVASGTQTRWPVRFCSWALGGDGGMSGIKRMV